jgi:PAS domain S-box-containing protein
VTETFRLPPLLHAAPVAIAAVDLQGRVLDANRALLDISGYTLEDLRGAAFTRFVAPGREGVAGHFAALARGEIDTYRVERRYLTRNGQAREMDMSVSLVRDESGAPELCLAVLHDVTDRKRTEAALRLSEARYRALVEQAPLSIQILSPDGRRSGQRGLGAALGRDARAARPATTCSRISSSRRWAFFPSSAGHSPARRS